MQSINLNHRKSIRLKEYDYTSPAEYFITICTYQRECLFGEIKKDEMALNSFGLIVQEEWLRTPIIRPVIELDEFIIMPNHFHGIIIIKEEQQNMVGTHSCASLQGKPLDASLQDAPVHITSDGRASLLQRKLRSLGAIIAGIKSAATKRINVERKMPRVPVWQPRFYEHIFRNDKDLNNIREYIVNNPMQWHVDEENPVTAGGFGSLVLPQGNGWCCRSC